MTMTSACVSAASMNRPSAAKRQRPPRCDSPALRYASQASRNRNVPRTFLRSAIQATVSTCTGMPPEPCTRQQRDAEHLRPAPHEQHNEKSVGAMQEGLGHVVAEEVAAPHRVIEGEADVGEGIIVGGERSGEDLC